MATKQTTRKSAAAPGRTRAERSTGGNAEQAPSLPVLVPAVHVRHVPVPRIGVGHVPVPKVSLPLPDQVRSRLPDPVDNRLLWWGGLAGLAAVGVIGWPVAGVVAAGTYVAEQRARHWLADHGDGDRDGAGDGGTRTRQR